MKKITLFALLMISSLGFSQTKSTGVIALNSNMTAKIDLDQSTSTVTLTITNPSASWFGLGFNTTVGNVGGGMPPNMDCVVMRSATNLSDSQMRPPNVNLNGNGNPNIDAVQNWTIVSNDDISGTRTLVATRAFNTGDAADYVFNFNDSSLNLIYASPATGNFTVGYHGAGAVRGFVNASLTTLGVEDFTLNATAIYPNPASGEFYIKAKTNLSKVNLYSQTGALVKTIDVTNNSSELKVDTNGIQSGVYFLELQNDSEKSWKKIIVN
jgi:hypothetical protein